LDYVPTIAGGIESYSQVQLNLQTLAVFTCRYNTNVEVTWMGLIHCIYMHTLVNINLYYTMYTHYLSAACCICLRFTKTTSTCYWNKQTAVRLQMCKPNT